ncbi:MAG: class I mannose-6-phosphate isomerase [Acidobacteriia bacterium]|nr:class I mannose-6-phosphate isomerase [Terriglobia bacterium]
MSELYPLLLKPEFRERIWGTRDLSPLFGQAPGVSPIGEVWLTGDECRVANGALTGASLGELCRRYGRDLVGETARETERFPLLVKFIFPRDKLSVQVHPDDEDARRVGLPCGKTECWYVLQAAPGAKVGLGLIPGTTREQFARAIEEVRAEQLLNWIEVHSGEMIYVDAGTVHAIGPGVILLETQQNSDTTYRLYDYGRPRELHVQQGLAALKETTRAGKVEPQGDEDCPLLVDSPYFMVDRYRLRNDVKSASGCQLAGSNNEKWSWRTVEILVGLDGCGVVEAQGCQPVTFGRGDVVVIPAATDYYEIRAHWELEMLAMVLPPKDSQIQPRIYTNVSADQSGLV